MAEQHGAWAEVIAVYAGTPIDVQHIGRPAPPRSVAALLGLGAAVMLLGLVILANELSHDWHAHDLATRAAGERGDPRPPAPGHGLAALGAALVLLGVIPLTLGLIRHADPSRRDYTIGEHPDASFILPGPPHVLVEADGPALRLVGDHVSQGATRRTPAELHAAGDLEFDGEHHRWPLVPGARGQVVHGAVTFWIRAVDPDITRLPRAPIDLPVPLYSLLSLLLLGGLALLSHLAPRSELLDLDEPADHLKFVGYLHKQTVPAPPATATEPDPTPTTTPTPPVEAPTPASPRRPRSRTIGPAIPQHTRDHDPLRTAASAGILGILQARGPNLSLATAAYAPGHADDDVWTGPPIVPADHRGPALGGALGLSTRDSPRLSNPCGCASDRRRTRPGLSLDVLEVDGGLDPDDVRRILRAHINEVRACHPTPQSPFTASLEVHFSLAHDGSVRNAVIGHNSLQGDAVGPCVAGAVRRWRFPAAEDGALTLVSATYGVRL